MEKNLDIFRYEEKEVRTVTDENGEPWFVAKDVAEILGYTNPQKAVRDHCKYGQAIGVNESFIDIQTIIIPEHDMYRLVMRSKLPAAEKFETWVVKEVIPSIRKTGSYSVKKSNKFDIMRQMLDALEAQEKEIQRHEGEIRGLQMDVYKRDGYFSVAGYLSKLGRPCDIKTAAEHGRKLSGMCKKLRIETPKIDHPAFGSVNTYPEKMLDGYFGNGETRLSGNSLQ